MIQEIDPAPFDVSIEEQLDQNQIDQLDEQLDSPTIDIEQDFNIIEPGSNKTNIS